MEGARIESPFIMNIGEKKWFGDYGAVGMPLKYKMKIELRHAAGHRFPMFQTVGNYTQLQGLDRGKRLLACPTVDHYSGESADIGDPAASASRSSSTPRSNAVGLAAAFMRKSIQLVS